MPPSETQPLKESVGLAQLVRLGGGVRADAARRTLLGSSVAAIADVLVCIVAMSGGLRLGVANIIGFTVGATVRYSILARTVSGPQARFGPRLLAHLLVTALMALLIRDAVLASLNNGWGWPPQVAIVLAVAATTLVMQSGETLSLAAISWKLGRGEHWRAIALWIIVFAAVLRLVYVGQAQLIPEETYYWNYAQHPDLGYLDHPPMVAWLIRAGTALLGDTELGVRLGALVSAAVASLFVYRLTRNLFGQSSALVSLVLMQVLPFFFLAGMLMTPDAPLTAAWAGTLYFLERALLGGQGRGWLGAGFCAGVGLLSKYTIGLLVPAAVLFCQVDASARFWLRRWQPYAACSLAVILFAPVIFWNAEHQWASFAFQTARRLADTPRFGLHGLLLSALVLLTPTGFLTLLVAMFGRDRLACDAAPGLAARAASAEGAEGAEGEASARRRWRFIRASVLVPLSVFALFSLRHEVKIDWTGALWVGAVPALAQAIVCFGHNGSTWWRRFAHAAWIPTVLLLLLAYGAALHYLVLGLPNAGYSRHLELVPVAWRELGQQISVATAELRARGGSEPLVVGMDRYVLASELAFYARDGRAAVRNTAGRSLFGLDALMYERWFPAEPLKGRTLLLVGWDAADIADRLIEPHVDRLEPIRQGTLLRDGAFVTHYYYRAAYGFH